ncbi:hypothetical protein [Nocardioides pocheonensis]|uniref:Uncharacterized protein n=1 Tax=Nocardioides pocheonensis TaxID=661485 RepID=A0A3N0GUC7_9ACTN|nr:hypothetical protein [Nocardioides pocheonensis]RNM16073.1 hypothetical protein EFL26_07935 [Nocardioides pocheonensis]
MDTWAWLTVAGVVAVILALAWWSSGRASLRGHGPESSLTPEQRESIDVFEIRKSNVPGSIG